jgi:hypothetical protein
MSNRIHPNSSKTEAQRQHDLLLKMRSKSDASGAKDRFLRSNRAYQNELSSKALHVEKLNNLMGSKYEPASDPDWGKLASRILHGRVDKLTGALKYLEYLGRGFGIVLIAQKVHDEATKTWPDTNKWNQHNHLKAIVASHLPAGQMARVVTDYDTKTSQLTKVTIIDSRMPTLRQGLPRAATGSPTIDVNVPTDFLVGQQLSDRSMCTADSVYVESSSFVDYSELERLVRERMGLNGPVWRSP